MDKNTITLKNVRLSFPDLFVPKAFKEGDVPKYKATFLLPKGSSLARLIETAIEKTLNEKWPKKGATIFSQIRNNANKCCFQDGDTKAYDGYAGMMSLSANSKIRPVIRDRDGTTTLAQDDGRPYAGCYVNGHIELFTYDNTGKGISASLRGVQFVKDGEQFGGGTPMSDDEFEDLSKGSDAADLIG